MVQQGRYTADIDGDFVVFLIGMRLNHPLRVGKWWPVATAIPRMLKVLSRHPARFLRLSAQACVSGGSVALCRYDRVRAGVPGLGRCACSRRLSKPLPNGSPPRARLASAGTGNASWQLGREPRRVGLGYGGGHHDSRRCDEVRRWERIARRPKAVARGGRAKQRRSGGEERPRGSMPWARPPR